MYRLGLVIVAPLYTGNRCRDGIVRSSTMTPGPQILGFLSAQKDTTAGDFVQTCAQYLSQSRRAQDGSRGVQAIELTITHKSGIVYGGEVWQTIEWLQELRYYAPTRLVVIYKSPLPQTQLRKYLPIHDLSAWEIDSRSKFPGEPEIGEQARSERGIFVKPLEKDAFDKHVDGLEW